MDIFEFLRKTVHKLVGVPEEEIRPESTKEELNLDMFDVQELVIDVEEEYDVLLPETGFETLGELESQVRAA